MATAKVKVHPPVIALTISVSEADALRVALFDYNDASGTVMGYYDLLMHVTGYPHEALEGVSLWLPVDDAMLIREVLKDDPQEMTTGVFWALTEALEEALGSDLPELLPTPVFPDGEEVDEEYGEEEEDPDEEGPSYH